MRWFADVGESKQVINELVEVRFSHQHFEEISVVVVIDVIAVSSIILLLNSTSFPEEINISLQKKVGSQGATFSTVCLFSRETGYRFLESFTIGRSPSLI